jgi:DNA-binding transcriptional regulator YiaG
MYHYIESGLDYVWLANGYTIHKTEYGDAVSIEQTDALHKVLATEIVNSPAPLTGAQFRFLRIEMELSQRRLAELINADEQAVARWEKTRGKPVKGAAERMIRVVYKAFSGNGSIKNMIERLAALDAVSAPAKVVMREKDNEWRAEAA